MTKYRTPNGPIFAGGTCDDDPGNLRRYDQPGTRREPVVLQEPAMESFREAERRWAKYTRPWRRGENVRIIELIPGSDRTCELQGQLFEKDSDRYADPDVSLHPRHLAIDIFSRSPVLGRILRRLGWKQARPDDEPWHWSYWLEA